MSAQTVFRAVESPTLPKRRVNEMIRARFLVPLDDEMIGFVCECADAACHKVVWLTGGGYDEARVDPAWHPLVTGDTAPATDSEEAP